MNLWTEYEGRTVAGDYYLETLLRSEGRSAFFKTHGKADNNAVIRLTEIMNGERESDDGVEVHMPELVVRGTTAIGAGVGLH